MVLERSYKMIWPCIPTPLYLYQCAAIVERAGNKLPGRTVGPT